MANFKFHGSSDHDPMLWAVDTMFDGSAYVMESYDDGATWICNCHLDSEQAGWDFIAAWFAQFYE